MMSRVRIILMAITICFLGGAALAQRAPQLPVIEALQALYDGNKQFRLLIDQAFVHMQDPDPHSAGLWPTPTAVNPWKGKSFDDLLQFFEDWYYLLSAPSGVNDEFNYIEKFAWFYYENPYGQEFVGEEPGLSWTRDFVEARLQFLESRESTAAIPQWIADPTIHIEQYVVPPGGFESFNEFFTRELKTGTRPIASPTDDSVLVSPTDCLLNMINPLTPGKKIPTKLNQQLTVKELLAGSKYADYFENGTALSCILLPTTYHHYHSVVPGRVVESREDVSGAYWGISDFGTFYNAGNIGYGSSYSVFEQFRRGYLVIQTDEYGYVAMVPVGLDTIGSVVFEEPFKHATPANPVSVLKGDRLGHFAYGGSLVITLVEQGISSVKIPQGQQIGVFAQKKVPPPR